jgi:hypothetical protein
MLLVLSWPAFRYFFIGEAFQALRVYDENGRHLWQAVFSRIDQMFFRPGFILAHIGWYFILPPNPLVYHIRNFGFCAINLFLLHRLLLKVVRSPRARIAALGMFAASKIHLTLIGYINDYEISIFLMTILLTVLFWCRYLESRRLFDYILTLIFSILSVYSKDNGFMISGVLAAMTVGLAIKPGGLKNQIQYWALKFMPFAIVPVSYEVLRYILIGPINPNNPTYSPRLSFLVAVRQTTGFLATVGNFSLTSPGRMGQPGLTGVLAGNSKAVECALCMGLWLLIIYTVWKARSEWRVMIAPIAGIGLYLLPTFLIRNHQVYYYQEPLVGTVILIGICLDRVQRPPLKIWFAVIALIAINGFISSRRSYYDWQFAADRAEVVKPLVASQKNNPPKSIVIVTPPEDRDFWFFTLREPMISHLLGSPATHVELVSRPEAVTLAEQQLPEDTVFFDVDHGLEDASQVIASAGANPASLSPEKPKTAATIAANPNPIRVCDGSGLGTTTIFFTFAESNHVEIHVNSPTGDLFAKPAASGSAMTEKWVSNGMVFYLQDVTHGRPLTAQNTLGTVTVNLTTAGCE